MNIPAKMIHIWIGPKPAPIHWMNTWHEKHPHWQYMVFDNAWFEKTSFYNQSIIDEYYQRGKYNAVADLIRYELLYDHGGFLPPADAICLENTDELWTEPEHKCYTVYEHERARPHFVSPIYASNAGNEFLEKIIIELSKVTVKTIETKKVWQVTGNEFLRWMIKRHKPAIKIFPSHYFIPKHYSAKTPRYNGPDKIYADQMWGSTKQNYKDTLEEYITPSVPGPKDDSS
jgi:mannosyltransferase OCH1-like enzyme